jgi:Fe-S-cluster containining protein
MSDGPLRDDGAPLHAGEFSSWLRDMEAALAGVRDADVPCDGCTACCRASQFVHITPEETDTLAHIPRELLFPAPRAPKGHVLMGYDEHGRCPMLVGDRCSIYAHRPRACRTYDCRVFAASGVDVDDETKAEVAARVTRWRFDHPTAEDDARHDAVRSAARFLAERAEDLPPVDVPVTSTQRAVMAVELHRLFLEEDETGGLRLASPSTGAVQVELTRRRTRRERDQLTARSTRSG